MSLTEPIAIVAAALITGIGAGIPPVVGRRNRQQRIEEEQRRRSDELEERLSQRYEDEITYLKGQVADLTRTVNRLRGRGAADDQR